MKIHEAKKFLPFVQALADGKTVEYRNLNNDNPWTDIAELPNSQWFTPLDSMNRDFRIKPEPKFRPWRPEEVPVGAQIRTKGDGMEFRSLIVGVGMDSIDFVIIGNMLASSSFEETLVGDEHSIDGGKTWLPCGISEDAQ